MFITNELTPAEVLAELLKGRRTSAEATGRFNALRHDKDLVPSFGAHIHSILDVYKAYRTDVHDIQSIRDDGVDVLLRFEHDGVEHRAGLQIKSNAEFEEWANKKLNVVEKLKAQYSAAKENARVDDYYVVLCADDRAHRRRIRTLCSELKNYRGCTVIEPRDALGFYEMSDLDLMVRTTRLLCNTDTILRMALSEADAEEPAAAFILASLVCHAFEGGLHVDETNLFELWSDWSELGDGTAASDDRLADVTQKLLDDRVLEHDDDNYAIDVTRLPVPLCALFFDLLVRNLATGANIRDYIVGLLELRDRASSELADHDIEADDE